MWQWALMSGVSLSWNLGWSCLLWVLWLSADLRWPWLGQLHVSHLPAASSGMFSWSRPRNKSRHWIAWVLCQTSACAMSANKSRGWAQWHSVRETTTGCCGQGCTYREKRRVGVFNAFNILQYTSSLPFLVAAWDSVMCLETGGILNTGCLWQRCGGSPGFVEIGSAHLPGSEGGKRHVLGEGGGTWSCE